MTPIKAEKCAHPVCSCMTTSGGYSASSAKQWKRWLTSLATADMLSAQATRITFPRLPRSPLEGGGRAAVERLHRGRLVRGRERLSGRRSGRRLYFSSRSR